MPRIERRAFLSPNYVPHISERPYEANAPVVLRQRGRFDQDEAYHPPYLEWPYSCQMFGVCRRLSYHTYSSSFLTNQLSIETQGFESTVFGIKDKLPIIRLLPVYPP